MTPRVLIIGAGPVGLTAALALARRKVSVRIVEKSAQRTDKSKALVLWPRTLELLDIEACAEPFIDAGLKVRDARVLADDKELVHVSFAVARSAYRYALMLPQSDTERLLQEQLERHGVVVERGTALTSFADDGETVSAVLRNADGSTETVRSNWLVACDGAHSTVRHGLASATFEGDTLPSNWLLADLRIGCRVLNTITEAGAPASVARSRLHASLREIALAYTALLDGIRGPHSSISANRAWHCRSTQMCSHRVNRKRRYSSTACRR